LYERIEPYFKHADDRGSLRGLINTGEWREINIVDSQKDSIRGGHYHKSTKECFVILSGKILVQFRLPQSNGRLDYLEESVFEKGDVFVILPMVEHTFTVISDAQWINMLSMPLSIDSPDFHRYG
jgi:dTDP-4-dehydrorhamnose 3,5-epimerase-like enzyme